MGKKSSGEKRGENLNNKIKDLERQKNDLENEVNEKRKELNNLEENVKLAKEDPDAAFAKLKQKAEEEVSKDCESMINDANEQLKSAKEQLEDANRKMQEADEQSAKIEKEKKNLETEKKKFSNDCKEKEKEFKSREANLKPLEDKLIEQENKQAEIQNDLDKRCADAKFNFQIELREERIKFDDDLSRIKKEIAGLEKEKIKGRESIDSELKEYKEKELAKISNEIQNQKKDIENQKLSIQDEKAKLEARKIDLDTKEEAIKIRKDAYDKKYEQLDAIIDERVQELHKETINEKEAFKNRCNELQKDVSEKQKTIINLTKKINDSKGIEVDSLKEENNKLREEIKSLKEDETSIIGKLKKYKVDSASLVKQLYKIEEFDNLMNQVESLNKENNKLKLDLSSAIQNDDALELEVRRANQYQSNYENAISELERLKKPSRKDRLSSFTSFEEFDDITTLDAFGSQLSEINWLKNIKDKMEQSEIKISNKLLYAFHTSVKIHDWSPLVVLAGVSGTGKSELPRQYAHHGGMNFIAVPVKPDWDSMQSLFGYYNSIENKFEPTELCRAIYYMQSAQMKNTMLLVLLDEMNLAYVELYFSDLLSKFETNRGTDNTITYEISLGANEAPEKMEIGNNILWVGTMNEDETTKALSDKVVDRSTLITFPRPKTLVSRSSDIKIPDTEKRLTQNLWLKWCANSLNEEQLKNKGFDIEKYRKIIEDINDEMSKVNRNLGHRVWQSIERYVFSHPMTVLNINNGSEFKKQFDSAFAEAVAFKVMPKLRGIEVSGDSKKVLESIQKIIYNEIPSLSEDYAQAMKLSSHIFQWCSAKFMDVDEEKKVL